MKNQVSENPVKNREKDFTMLTVVACILTAIYLASNVMAVKVISIKGVALFDAGTITFPFAYMLGDALTEVWGFKNAKKVIFLTFFCNIIMVVSTTIGVYLPAPEYMEETTKAYSLIFGYVPRIVVGSLAAFLAGELANAWVLEKIKEKTGEKKLWIRLIGSSAVGYAIDTTIFVLIAFLGTSPVKDIFSMIVIQYFAKLLMESLAGTPLAYWIISVIKKRLKSE